MTTQKILESLHPDYIFVKDGITISGSGRDIKEYLSEYGYMYDIRPNFHEVLGLYQNSDLNPIGQNLRLDRLNKEKNDDQIWEDTGIRNSKPAVIVERWIEVSAIMRSFPIIIGYFNDNPVWIFRSMMPGRMGVDMLDRNRIWNEHTHLISPDLTTKQNKTPM